MKTIILTLLMTSVSAFAQRLHIANHPHAGDTVLPGTPAWIHAGSPRSTITGDSILLIWGADGKLHPLGYAIEDTGGIWVANTLAGREGVEDHKELLRLKAAVRQIALDMPDRKILSYVTGNAGNIRTPGKKASESGSDPYKELMKWADSIARVYNAPYFLKAIQDYYQSRRSGVEPTPFDRRSYN